MRGDELHRLRARLRATRPAADLPEGFRRAGVLVPILVSDVGADVLLTVRSSRMPHHAGQIAFPGGGALPGETPEEAARREAYEEVGLVVPESAVLGRLSDLPSPARYLATPVVAVLPTPVSIRLDPSEVEEVFTVPLEELRAATPFTTTRTLRGSIRTLHHYPWRDREIWGFTGNVLRELLGHLAADDPVEGARADGGPPAPEEAAGAAP